MSDFLKAFRSLLGLRSNQRQPAASLADPGCLCSSCGADWLAGMFAQNCRECGGGAMTRDCPYCDGTCGAAMYRAVIDSHDARSAHWLGACARPVSAGRLLTADGQAAHHLFRFGYQTPHQLRMQQRNPDWDDEDSTAVFILAESEAAALPLGFAYADAWVRKLFLQDGAGTRAAYPWSAQPYAHWFEHDAEQIKAMRQADAPVISSLADIDAAISDSA